MTTTQLKLAEFGSVSTATLRTSDLLTAFISEMEWQLARNGEYFSQPEHFPERDSLNNLIGEAQDCFSEDGDDVDLDKEHIAEELVNESFPDAFQMFCKPYCYFGAHPGDGADIGFWPPEIHDVKEQVEFVSSREQEYPDDDFSGEWLHVNDHGNCTLYLRENGQDRELWSVV